MKKIYVSEKDIKEFRDLFGTDYSGQEQTQEYMEAVFKWKKKKEKAIQKFKERMEKGSNITRILEWIKKQTEVDSNDKKD